MIFLLAEDEAAMADAISAYLSYHQHTVDWVDNGIDALSQAESKQYDGLILDLMMPGMDGLTVLRTLRRHENHIPVLILTAKGEVRDKVDGLEAGGDDYLTKPFAMEELLARINTMTRRAAIYHGTQLAHGNLTLNQDSCTAAVEGIACPLHRREYQLLELLMRHPNQFFSAEMLLDRIWGMDADVEQGTVWVHISNLRKKLESLNADVRIVSKRNVGYALEVLR